MLKELEILNGNLELDFNEYTYTYTVTVNKDVNSLEFDYVLEEECYINIRNNTLVEEENIVSVDVYNLDKTITYTFYVYKEESKTVSGIDDFVSSLEVSSEKTVSIQTIQILSCSLFLAILILFSIIFRRKKQF